MSGNKLLKDRRLYVIFSITLVGVMGVASLTPALPRISQALELNTSEIALLISAFTFPGIFLTPVAGVFADRLGRKAVLIPSLFIFGLLCFITALIFFIFSRYSEVEVMGVNAWYKPIKFSLSIGIFSWTMG